ncbi:MAG: MBL fold metallo-hydrolase [gamma proteobacterium symbiont of Ctena orbiculata]|uniref:MBL fold metallo-hydrolase n=1 Tax=Candidatus Thiodiazotropha taylori TaxID=2792791 RepID=A0A944QV85_9GAMM|nr:MBL fold metallo-hydrolase [Candidatus Thiodiazotropha taylori]PUB88586.1 MAG: MBL fold metallo-hydrolase [gamma proteobacterium symbiont of Ctena orbiculata]MBT2989734.1 MBL fold metallo-hydrolase [Candidatus Thiodiazotropha taylori]MBT2995927.1 MBL fold metallo-hydrolase [Candidatus Thiodiazotropha taylori]MBT2999242.1 MBL fold metallo-hydrolase [Candidatus Thiodiazotropha taylori]
MGFAILGSGSQGNALVIETQSVRVLVDCGFPARIIEQRLSGLGIDAESLSAILVTHEHGDHVRGVGALARRYRLPVWMTPGTFHGANYGKLPVIHEIDCHAGWWCIGDLAVKPYPVPHDSREPCQFLFRADGDTLGLLTDTGYITPHIAGILQACDSLILEFNHDPQMLANGPYPPSLRARVGGSHGHLNNQQAMALLQRLQTSRLQRVVASHLSEKNNSPQLVTELIVRQLPALRDRFSIATQHRATSWYQLGH